MLNAIVSFSYILSGQGRHMSGCLRISDFALEQNMGKPNATTGSKPNQASTGLLLVTKSGIRRRRMISISLTRMEASTIGRMLSGWRPRLGFYCSMSTFESFHQKERQEELNEWLTNTSNFTAFEVILSGPGAVGGRIATSALSS